jgi:hypothetical protein
MPDQGLSEKNYEFPAAGRTWIVPEYPLSCLRDGTLGVRFSDLRRIHRFIAWKLCQEEGTLSLEEFEFLADISDLNIRSDGLYKKMEEKWKSELGDVVRKEFQFFLFGMDFSPVQDLGIYEKGARIRNEGS